MRFFSRGGSVVNSRPWFLFGYLYHSLTICEISNWILRRHFLLPAEEEELFPSCSSPAFLPKSTSRSRSGTSIVTSSLLNFSGPWSFVISRCTVTLNGDSRVKWSRNSLINAEFVCSLQNEMCSSPLLTSRYCSGFSESWSSPFLWFFFRLDIAAGNSKLMRSCCW